MNSVFKKTLSAYLGNTLWYYLHINELDKVKKDFVLSVIKKIEDLENQLINLGISETVLVRLLKMVEKISITPIEKMPMAYQKKIQKLIFSTPTIH